MTPVGRTPHIPVIRWRLLPLALAVIGIALAFKAGHFAGDLGRLVARAQAQEGAEAAQDAEPRGSTADEIATEAPQDSDASADPPPEPSILSGISRAEMTLLEDLRRRREDLEEREQEIALREQLLAATERRIDKKIAELRTIEERVGELVKAHAAQEDAQLASVVKVYETMKPKDAAPIFQRLDLPIQISVAIRMKEAKMAAILSEMTPDAAKTLTTRLATRTALPEADAILDDSTSP